MKFTNKCPVCNRLATRRFRGRHFCDDCQRIVRRKKVDVVYREVLVLANVLGGKGFQIYADIPLKLH